MDLSNPRRQINQYQVVETQAVEVASPYKIIQMLLNGALARISTAKGHMERGKKGECGELISKAISIIEGLRNSLDKSIGGEVVENLEALYDYMNRQLLQANLQQQPGILDEVTKLLQEIKAGWDAIPIEEHDAHDRREQVLAQSKESRDG